MTLQKTLGTTLVGLTLTFLSVAPGMAQVAKESHDTLSSLAFRSPRLAPSQAVVPLADHLGESAASVQSGWEMFRLAAGPEWQASIDQRTGRIAFAEGGGVAWIPGRGNSLKTQDFKAVNLAALEAIARGYLPKIADSLGIDPLTLVLNRGRSGQPAGHVWLVDFDIVHDGMTVEGARLVFRVNNGNLIQIGTENLPSPGAAVPAARLDRTAALAAAARAVGGFGSADTFLDSGSLHLLPINVVSTRSAEDFDFGRGRGLAKVWQFTFHRDGVLGTWQVRVDAATGEVLEIADVNHYDQVIGQATGGIYTDSPAVGGEVVRPLPFADLSTGGYTNSAGLFNGSPATSTLNGQYVKIADGCGAISLTTNGAGNLPFGTSAGTDCATPGTGGAGNTHAARTELYLINRAKEIGRGWLPGNTWINQQLLANTNLNLTCNAYWNGVSINFFKSGNGCNNTGEIAGVALHEYGHGLDQNDGSGGSAGGAESYADIVAVLALHSSCVGPGFFQSRTCSGYGNPCTTCTATRDIDYAKRQSNIPATVANFSQFYCDSPGGGPCGGEDHCESYVSSEAVWDFANRDLPGAGGAAAWRVLERLWYLSRSTATTSFSCHTGGVYTSDGCSAGSWWKAMRALDDDDGNLTNGTPHGAALFAAFNRHGIACTTDPGANVTFAGCAPPAVPALAASAFNNVTSLSWTDSGFGKVYEVFRNEAGCNAGFAKIGTTYGTSFADNAVANGTTYYYQVSAYPEDNEACSSAPSTCMAVTPIADTPPTASFTASCVGRVCSFNAGASTDDHGIVSYQWDWHDTTTSTTATPTIGHTYATDAIYAVRLTVKDGSGQTATVLQGVLAVDHPPVAHLTVTCSGLFCEANASTSTDDLTGLTFGFSWAGETPGSYASTSVRTHTYSSPGLYTIAVTAKDSAGQTSTVSVPVNVHGTTAADTVAVDKGDDEFKLRLYLESGAGSPIKVVLTGISGYGIAGDWNGDHVSSTGRYVASTATFYLRNTNSNGAADLSFVFGTAGATRIPVAGDWNNDGTDTVGLYDPATGTFSLRNSNSAGSADITFTFTGAAATWLPIVGDWNGDGTDTVGLYDPATSTFYLRNSNTTGGADLSFVFGTAATGLVPNAGDWNGDGWDTIGVFDPATGVHSLRDMNNAGTADHVFTFSTSTANRVVAGDWDGI
jgi:hypothetical protein